MRVKFAAALSAIVLSAFFEIGCGDTFRPIAIPIVQPGGQPQSTRHAVVISNAGAAADGATTHINLSGDTNVGVVSVGRDPVHATFVNSSVTVVANRANDSLNFYSTFLVGTASAPNPAPGITLTPGSAPAYLFSNLASTVFVANSGLGSVGVVNISGPSLTTNIPVGPNPVALTGTTDGTRVYVANQGNGTVSVIDTTANALVPSSTSLPNPITVGASPSFLAIKPDNSRVYAVNSVSNSVSVIDTSSNSVTNVPVGANPTHAFYEAGRNRLWVTNSGSNSVTVINALDLNDVRTVSLVDTSATTPCANPTPVAVTVLADGTRAYIASKGCDAVTVVNASSLSLSKTIKLGAGAAPVSIASDSPSAKVVAANSGTCQLTSTTVGNCASVIQTSDDSIAAQIATPAPNRFVLITP